MLIRELVHEDHQRTIQDIAETVNMLYGTVHTILTYALYCFKVHARDSDPHTVSTTCQNLPRLLSAGPGPPNIHIEIYHWQ